jgi:hypothetical protein
MVSVGENAGWATAGLDMIGKKKITNLDANQTLFNQPTDSHFPNCGAHPAFSPVDTVLSSGAKQLLCKADHSPRSECQG